jgi:mitogen-activated protein kinase kinase 3
VEGCQLCLGKITFAVVSALHYLHSKLKVIHRDVKPSNILISRQGQVKMCDFGISGYLVDSIAKTIDAGCKPYMAVSVSLAGPIVL